MSEASHIRQLVAIMFTDIVGYTALMGDQEEKAFTLLDKNRQLQKPLIESYGGKWIKELGDGVLATFSTVSEAVFCAVAIQQESKDVPDLNLRIGINQGEVVFKDGDVFGDGVNIASRIETLATTGGILISEAVKVNIQNKQGIQTVFVREERLKNVKDPVKIYEINAAEVELPEHVPAGSGTPQAVEQVKPGSSGSNKLLLVSFLVVAASTLIYFFYPFQAKENNIDLPKTIAVLAFDDQSPNGDQEWLGDGMADEILNVLANVEGLQVTGKTSSFSFKGKGLTTKEIGEKLNVGFVLEGSVIKIGNKLRITAQLIDLETDAHIFSKKYDRDAADIFNIMDEVAQSIADALKSKLSIEDLAELKIGYNVDPEAYEYFLKGQYISLNKFLNTLSDDDLKQAEKMFFKAIAIDSTYADAYGALADIYDAKAWTDRSYNKKRDSLVNIAYRIDPNSTLVLLPKGAYFRKQNSFNLDSTFYYYKRAYTADPKNSAVNINIFMIYWQIGLYENAIKVGRKIVMSDPFALLIRARLAKSYRGIGEIEKAREENLKVLEIDSNFRDANYNMLKIALFYDKNKEEAVRRINKILSLDSTRGFNFYNSLLLALDGNRKEALELNKDLWINSLLDMKEEGIRNLDTLNTRNANFAYPNYLDYLNGKELDFIRDEARFKEIIAEAKKVHEEWVAKYGHLFDE
jgi:adenylate cyclase